MCFPHRKSDQDIFLSGDIIFLLLEPSCYKSKYRKLHCFMNCYNPTAHTKHQYNEVIML